MEKVWAFWEGPMPEYLKLCMETWRGPYKLTILNYKNIYQYTEFDVEGVKRFTLPQIADVVRVHVLRDNGGYWLDTDTIMLEDELPKQNIAGNIGSRTNSIGYLHTEKDSEMFKLWAEYQDKVIANSNSPHNWDIMGNAFTDEYVRNHEEITIYPIGTAFPETYVIPGLAPRREKYKEFYFKSNYSIRNVLPTKMLMLHNSWTPDWYKQLDRDEVLNYNCTMSNILREVL